MRPRCRPAAALALLLAVPAHAACPADPADLRRTLEEAGAAYLDLDLDGFRSRLERVRDDVPCLETALGPSQAARVHFAYALGAFLDRDQDRMLRAVRGVLAADPAFEPGEDVARPGSDLYVAFQLARRPRDPVVEPLPEGAWVVDGRPGVDDVPLDRNTLVQRVDVQPVRTWYVQEPVLPEGLAPPTPAPVLPQVEVRRRSRPLLAVGIGAGVVSVAALSGAAVLKDRYYDEEDPPIDPDAVRTWNHVAGIGGWALATGAAGLGLGAVVLGEW